MRKILYEEISSTRSIKFVYDEGLIRSESDMKFNLVQ